MMLAKITLAAVLTASLAACVAPPLGEASSGASPANFSYKSDGENAKALLVAAETTKPVSWKVSDSSYGAVTPDGSAFPDQVRRTCQPLKHQRDGITRSVTACKGADGMWVVAEWVPAKGE
ncbi:MAG: hypothetical protein AB7G62_01170 [Magnetospirillum sp.]